MLVIFRISTCSAATVLDSVILHNLCCILDGYIGAIYILCKYTCSIIYLSKLFISWTVVYFHLKIVIGTLFHDSRVLLGA